MEKLTLKSRYFLLILLKVTVGVHIYCANIHQH